MENFKLPARWCIDSRLDRDLIGKWFNENTDVNPSFRTSIDYSRDLENCNFYHYPRLWEGSCTSVFQHNGYTEITLEQFKKYVLKERDTMELQNRTYSLGDFFHVKYGPNRESICLLAQVDYSEVALIDIKDGNRAYSPVSVRQVDEINFLDLIPENATEQFTYLGKIGEYIVSKWNSQSNRGV